MQALVLKQPARAPPFPSLLPQTDSSLRTQGTRAELEPVSDQDGPYPHWRYRRAASAPRRVRSRLPRCSRLFRGFGSPRLGGALQRKPRTLFAHIVNDPERTQQLDDRIDGIDFEPTSREVRAHRELVMVVLE